MTKRLTDVVVRSADNQEIRLREALSDKTIFVLVRYFG